MSSRYADPARKPPLDQAFLVLSSEELSFFKSQTKIEDEDELKEHIISVQKKAYEIYGYPCIRFFVFTKLKISRLPGYQSALKLSRDRPDAVLLDIGCCSNGLAVGNDLRKAVSDGWPIQNVIGSDLQQGFWDFGHELFKTTHETYPAAFVAGDAFDSNMIAPLSPFTEVPETPRPNLDALTSLTPLQGHISAIHASSFFHLFSEHRQHELAQRVATLLSPLPGSVIFGSHIGRPEKGIADDTEGEPGLFCHSPESWCELWDGQVFDSGAVKVKAMLKEVERPDMKLSKPFYFLNAVPTEAKPWKAELNLDLHPTLGRLWQTVSIEEKHISIFHDTNLWTHRVLTMSVELPEPTTPPLDDSFYIMDDDDELAFFKQQTGIWDDKDLKEHILAVQEKAYEVTLVLVISERMHISYTSGTGLPLPMHPSVDVHQALARLKISRLPAYQEALALPKKYFNALFLDIACCFGNDVLRRSTITAKSMITDGGGSLGFWNCGHDLFRSTPESFPAVFIEGDAFDPAVIAPRDPFYAPEECAPLEQPLSSLTSLTPLQGKISAIHASSFFHLFDEAEQLQLARQVATLLSPAPGSIIFGAQGGRVEKGFRTVLEALTSSGKYMFCHSPETWKELWDGEVFKKGTVKVEAGLQEVERNDLSTDPELHFFIMSWSVTRL
ncbi:hypothetical protein DXG01_010200 [Tephrocybe rancida]|nr:hypothetical protein DXG01_010200 [Tephrocybe rancida]